MKLNKAYYEKYCICCGRDVQEIWAKLLNQPMVKYGKKSMKQVDGCHWRLMGKDYFHDSDEVHNCPKCGTEYQEDDILSREEAVGEFGGQSAYQDFLVSARCGECGHEEGF